MIALHGTVDQTNQSIYFRDSFINCCRLLAASLASQSLAVSQAPGLTTEGNFRCQIIGRMFNFLMLNGEPVIYACLLTFAVHATSRFLGSDHCAHGVHVAASNHGLRSKSGLYKSRSSIAHQWVFRSVSGIKSPFDLALGTVVTTPDNNALALCAVRPCHRPTWSHHPSLTTLGRRESKAFMGLYS